MHFNKRLPNTFVSKSSSFKLNSKHDGRGHSPWAGIEGSERSAFLAYDSLGSFLWTALYAGLGYLFANPLTLIAASMAKFGPLLAATICIPLACYVVWRIGIMAQMLRHLRRRTITLLLLNVKITAGESIAIIDLVRPMRGRRFYAPV